jgi:hypothetical protein
MKHLKLFESFEEIDSICEICEIYNIENYTINSDGTVDVDGDVDLSRKGLTKLPLNFGKVTGYFYCYNNKLTTLEGSPISVGGYFGCYNNKLTTLEGGPREVGGDFYCNYNQLITLEGSPREVGGHFSCSYNPIYSVYRLFPDHKSFMDSLDYNYLRGTDVVMARFKEALDEIGKEMPEKIKGYNYI